jgi:sulfate permease, SulP family
VLLAGLRPDFAKGLDNLRFKEWLPADRIFPEEDEIYSATLAAVRHAYELIRAAKRPGPASTGETEYYLV